MLHLGNTLKSKMQVISSSENTQLHTFPALHTDFTYPHAGGKRLDIQCKPDRNLFLAVNPSIACFELLRKSANKSTSSGSADVISRVKKILLNNAKCGACSGPQRNEVAIGQEDGTIRFYDLKKSEMSKMRFRAGWFLVISIFLMGN